MKEVAMQSLLLNIVIVNIVVIWILNWLSRAGALGEGDQKGRIKGGLWGQKGTRW